MLKEYNTKVADLENKIKEGSSQIQDQTIQLDKSKLENIHLKSKIEELKDFCSHNVFIITIVTISLITIN